MDEHDSPPSRRTIIGALAAAVLVIAAISFFVGRTVDQNEMHAFVERLRGFGDEWWAPLALIGAFILINLTGIPGTPLTLAAGTVWGWRAGGAWVMAGVMIGTAPPYAVAKALPRVRHVVEQRFGSVAERIRDEGMFAVLILRLMHIFPFAAISYGSGVAGVRFRDYFIGTFLGTLPGVFVYTYLADSILEGLVSPQEATRRMIVAGVLAASLVVGTRLVARRFSR